MNELLRQETALNLSRRAGLTEWESIFWTHSRRLIPPFEDAVAQFRRYESTGEYPTAPLIGFKALLEGKSSFFLTKKSIKDAYFGTTEAETSGWFGTAYLAETVLPDILAKYLDWHPSFQKVA